MSDPVLRTLPLGFVWETTDPFLFCVHHDDAYPAGNTELGPSTGVAGRSLGSDFEPRDGWRMYHGHVVPGFPQHPHRGFETVTIMRRGTVDHSDSLGAAARFGPGDVQWLTAGRGIVHSEMFPLLDPVQANPLELFQIWLNLPAADKMVEPHFSILWAEGVPTLTRTDSDGGTTEITVVAGRLDEAEPPAPPPRSWARRADSHVAIWSIRMGPHARWTLPPGPAGCQRSLYLFQGGPLEVAGGERPRTVSGRTGMRLQPQAPVPLQAGPAGAELLLLQGRPIGEPVANHGPFVMNTRVELQQAYADYQRTRFGGWPWSRDDPAHPRDAGRFARHADGKVERPG